MLRKDGGEGIMEPWPRKLIAELAVVAVVAAEKRKR